MGSVAEYTALISPSTNPPSSSGRIIQEESECNFRVTYNFWTSSFKSALGSFLSHNFEHLLTNGTDLTSLCIACRLSLLVALLLGEANAKQSQMVTVSGADVHEGFNKRLPLANQGAQFVTGHVHAMEVVMTLYPCTSSVTSLIFL